jgi:hypothetical protein
LGKEYRPFSSSLCKNILLSTLFSNIISLRSSLNVGDQVAHPHKTTCKIIILYVLIFVFLDSNLEDKTLCTLLTYKKIPLHMRNHDKQPLGKFHFSTLLK